MTALTLRGERLTTWEVAVTPRHGHPVVIPHIDGRMDWGADRPHVAGGSFTTGVDMGDLVGAVIEPTLIINGNRFPQGRFQATADPSALATSATWTVEFIDPTIQLAIQKTQVPVSYPRGTRAVTAARQIFTQLGLPVAVPDSDVTLRVALAFERRVPWLDVATKLLGAAQLSRPRARPSGILVERLRAPDELPETWELVEGARDQVHRTSYRVDSDHLAVPNRLQLETRGDSTVTPLIGTARDQNTSRWSYERRGHWVDADDPREPLVTEVTTQQAINEEARRMLAERLARAQTVTVEHGWLPEVAVGSVGRFTSPTYPHLSGAWQVAAQTLPMSGTARASTTLRRVVRL